MLKRMTLDEKMGQLTQLGARCRSFRTRFRLMSECGEGRRLPRGDFREGLPELTPASHAARDAVLRPRSAFAEGFAIRSKSSQSWHFLRVDLEHPGRYHCGRPSSTEDRDIGMSIVRTAANADSGHRNV